MTTFDRESSQPSESIVQKTATTVRYIYPSVETNALRWKHLLNELQR